MSDDFYQQTLNLAVDDEQDESARATMIVDGDVTDELVDCFSGTSSTEQLPTLEEVDTPFLTGNIHSSRELVLKDDDSDVQFNIPNEELNQLFIGRSSTGMSVQPMINLVELDACRQGVSRHHAILNRYDGLIFITDNGSLNGTFLNGQRLVPHQARVLRDGDLLRLGHLSLSVSLI